MATDNSKLIDILVSEMNASIDQVAENAHFNKGYEDGLELPSDKLKELHQKADNAAKKNFAKYKEYDTEQVRDRPEAAGLRLKHGTAHHEMSSIRDGLAKAAKERGFIKEDHELSIVAESSVAQTERDQLAALLSGQTYTPSVGAQLLCEDEKGAYILHKAHGNSTLISKGPKASDLVGHVAMIPDVDMSTLDGPKDQVKAVDKFHAYGHGRHVTKTGVMKFTKQRLGAFDSHADAVAAVKANAEKRKI